MTRDGSGEATSRTEGRKPDRALDEGRGKPRILGEGVEGGRVSAGRPETALVDRAEGEEVQSKALRRRCQQQQCHPEHQARLRQGEGQPQQP